MNGRWTDRRGLLQAEEGICRAALEHWFNDIVPHIITKTCYGYWDDEEKRRRRKRRTYRLHGLRGLEGMRSVTRGGVGKAMLTALAIRNEGRDST